MFKTTALLAAVAALALSACGSSSSGGSSGGSSSKTTASSGGGYGGGYGGGSKTTAASSGGGKAATSGGEVEMYNNYFKPKVISGKPGSTVKIELKNEGSTEHSFNVDSQKIEKELEAGKDTTVSVKIPASGSLQFYCKYHKALGMTGAIKAA
jgi:plastocyanin